MWILLATRSLADIVCRTPKQKNEHAASKSFIFLQAALPSMAEGGGYAPPPLISAPSDTEQLGTAYLAPPMKESSPEDAVTVSDDRQQELYNYELAERSYSEQDQMKSVAPWLTLGLGSAGLIGARFLNHFSEKTSPDEDFMHRLGRSAVQTLAPGLDGAVKHATTFGNWIDNIRSLHTLASSTKTPNSALRLVHSFINDYAPPDKYAALMHATRIPRALLDTASKAPLEDRGTALLKALSHVALKDQSRSTMDPQAAALSLRYDHLHPLIHNHLASLSDTLQSVKPEVRTDTYAKMLDAAHKSFMSSERSKLMELGQRLGQTYQGHENDAELGNKLSKSALLASLGSTPARSTENVSPIGEYEGLQSGRLYLDNMKEKLYQREEARSSNPGDIAASAGARIGDAHQSLPFPYISDDKKTLAAQSRRLQEALGTNTSADSTSPELLQNALKARGKSLTEQYLPDVSRTMSPSPLSTFIQSIPKDALSNPAQLKELLDRAPADIIKPYRPFIETIGSSVVNKDDNALKELAVNYAVNKTKSALGADHPVTEILNGLQKVQALRKKHETDTITGLLTTKYTADTSRPLDLSSESLRYHAAKSISSFAKGLREGAGMQDDSFPARVWAGMRKIVDPSTTVATSVPEGIMLRRRVDTSAEASHSTPVLDASHSVSLPPPEPSNETTTRPRRDLPTSADNSARLSTGDPFSTRSDVLRARPAPVVQIFDTTNHAGLRAVIPEDAAPPAKTSTDSLLQRAKDRLKSLGAGEILDRQQVNEDKPDNWAMRAWKSFTARDASKTQSDDPPSTLESKTPEDPPATSKALGSTSTHPESALGDSARVNTANPRRAESSDPAPKMRDKVEIPNASHPAPLETPTPVSTLTTPELLPTSVTFRKPPSAKELAVTGADRHRAIGDTSSPYTLSTPEEPGNAVPARFQTVSARLPVEASSRSRSSESAEIIKSVSSVKSLSDLAIGPYQRATQPFSHPDFVAAQQDAATKDKVARSIQTSLDQTPSAFERQMKIPTSDIAKMRQNAVSFSLGQDRISKDDPLTALSNADPRRKLPREDSAVSHALAARSVFRSEYAARVPTHYLHEASSTEAHPLIDAAKYQMVRGILGARSASNAVYMRDLLAKRMNVDRAHIDSHVELIEKPSAKRLKSAVVPEDHRTYLIDHSHMMSVADAKLLSSKIESTTKATNQYPQETSKHMHTKFSNEFAPTKKETYQEMAKKNDVPVTNAHVLDRIPPNQQGAYHHRLLASGIDAPSEADSSDRVWSRAREAAAKDAIKSHLDTVKDTPGIYARAQPLENPLHSSTAFAMKLSEPAHAELQAHLHALTSSVKAPYVYTESNPPSMSSNISTPLPKPAAQDSSQQLISGDTVSRTTTATALTGSYVAPTSLGSTVSKPSAPVTTTIAPPIPPPPSTQTGDMQPNTTEGEGEVSSAFQ